MLIASCLVLPAFKTSRKVLWPGKERKSKNPVLAGGRDFQKLVAGLEPATC